MKIVKYIFACLILAFLTSCEKEIIFNEKPIVEKEYIKVDIKGAVMFPGVYSVEDGALLIDVVNMAGGFTNDVDIEKINLVALVSNNQMIFIPKVEELNNKLININTASIKDLTTLPGIGETKASKIIEYRNKNGSFTSVEQLLNVEGITKSIYEEIKTMVTL